VIRGRINDVDTNFHIKSAGLRGTHLSRDVFARPSEFTSADELSVRIDRATERYADGEYGKNKYVPPQVRL
jgi:hypothetical protein